MHKLATIINDTSLKSKLVKIRIENIKMYTNASIDFTNVLFSMIKDISRLLNTVNMTLKTVEIILRP